MCSCFIPDSGGRLACHRAGVCGGGEGHKGRLGFLGGKKLRGQGYSSLHLRGGLGTLKGRLLLSYEGIKTEVFCKYLLSQQVGQTFLAMGCGLGDFLLK